MGRKATSWSPWVKVEKHRPQNPIKHLNEHVPHMALALHLSNQKGLLGAVPNSRHNHLANIYRGLLYARAIPGDGAVLVRTDRTLPS